MATNCQMHSSIVRELVIKGSELQALWSFVNHDENSKQMVLINFFFFFFAQLFRHFYSCLNAT